MSSKDRIFDLAEKTVIGKECESVTLCPLSNKNTLNLEAKYLLDVFLENYSF